MGGEPKGHRNCRARRVGDEYRPEARCLGEHAPKQRSKRQADVVDAVEPAEDSPSLVLAGEVDTRHLAAQRPNAVPGAHHHD